MKHLSGIAGLLLCLLLGTSPAMAAAKCPLGPNTCGCFPTAKFKYLHNNQMVSTPNQGKKVQLSSILSQTPMEEVLKLTSKERLKACPFKVTSWQDNPKKLPAGVINITSARRVVEYSYLENKTPRHGRFVVGTSVLGTEIQALYDRPANGSI